MVLSLTNEKQNLITCFWVYLIQRQILCCEKITMKNLAICGQ